MAPHTGGGGLAGGRGGCGETEVEEFEGPALNAGFGVWLQGQRYSKGSAGFIKSEQLLRLRL